VYFLPSGNTSNVGKLCTAYREADDGELGIRNFYRKWGTCASSLLLTSKIPLRKKMIQMTGQSH
jgi:hypothetical protein